MIATIAEAAADPQQTIAELRRELDERTAERDAAQARELAAAEVLGVINSSPGDLAPVFDAMLERALRLCGAAFGNLLTYDGERFQAAAVRGMPEMAELSWVRGGFRPPPDGALDRVVRGESPVHILDLEADIAYGPSSAPEARQLVVVGKYRTLLTVALRKDDALLGVMTVYRQEVRPFSDEQIVLLQNFAAQAVIAMENARLITETREALEQQIATSEVLGVINSSPGDLAPVFDAMLEKAMTLCGAAHGSMQVYDGQEFRAVAVRGLPEAIADQLRQGFRPGPKHPIQGLLKGDSFVQILDLAQVNDPQVRVAAENGSRTLLCIPLRKEGSLVGQIVAVRQEVRPFTDKQIALLQNFAAQAVIAIENARLITETCEALEQQTATSEVLGVINSSPGDLSPVFDAMLEKAMRLCDGANGILWTLEGERARLTGSRGNSPEFVELLRQHGESGTHPLLRRVIRGEHLFQLNLPEHEVYQAGGALEQIAIEAGVRTVIWVALVKDGASVGAFVIGRNDLKCFSAKHIALLQNFAAQAVIAMENARLITETREALDQQTATAEVLQVINSSPGELTPVFDAMLEKATRLCEGAFGILWRFDGDLARPGALYRVPQAFAEFWREPRRPSPDSGPGRMMRGEGAFAVADLRELPPYQAGDPMFRAIVERGGARSVVIAPLHKDDATIGAITIYRQEVRPFSNKQVALLQNFAAQAVIAMENARLLGELRARTEEVAGLNRDLEARVASQLAELERTGRLKRFLAPQLADLIVAQGDESILESHRREIVVVFCDIRGFTAFAERAEPEEVMALLRDYHAALGPIVTRFEGTLDKYGGDGMMVFFNDPLPTPEPAKRAIDMAVTMREAAAEVVKSWRRHGHDIGFGVGISQGYATLGQIGFAERMDYTAIGTVTNLAARLCGEAKDGQILISRRVAVAVEDFASLEEIGDLSLKGLSQAVAVYNVAQ